MKRQSAPKPWKVDRYNSLRDNENKLIEDNLPNNKSIIKAINTYSKLEKLIKKSNVAERYLRLCSKDQDGSGADLILANELKTILSKITDGTRK